MIRNCWERIVGKIDTLKQCNYRKVYAQTGEDIIIKDLLELELGIQHVRYLDIGANDPRFLSNTYLFYLSGEKGVLVEPNPMHCKKIKRIRKRDTVLNCGVASEEGRLTYYMMNSDKINSFSEEEVTEYQKLGYTLVGKKELPVTTVNKILDKFGEVHFISIDVEGLDFNILKSIDFEKHNPICICIETCEHCGTKRKDFMELNDFLKRKGYMIYADTMLNTIYVKEKEFMISRKRK